MKFTDSEIRALSINQTREDRLENALKEIVFLCGNVDHATKTGANDALYRGQKLNDIREIANIAIKL